MLSTDFLLTSLVVVLIPGTGVIYTVSSGLFRGRKASIAAALGCTAGIIPHLLAAILGLSAILHMSSLVFQAIKYAGVVYLLYLAYSMWRETGTLQVQSDESFRNMYQIAVKGILINILNPKLSIFFLAFLPLFLNQDHASPLLQLLLLSGAFMAMTFFIFVLYGLLADATRRYIIHSPAVTQRLQKSFAAILGLLGVKLALTER